MPIKRARRGGSPGARDQYLAALAADKSLASRYYRASLVKTEQQKLLERLLKAKRRSFETVADVACGGGTLTYHLRALFPGAAFSLFDLNPSALQIAREINGESNCSYGKRDIYDLAGVRKGSFDLVCCWQTLLALEQPQKALKELLRITRPGGMVYASSLFNLHHDVDVSARIVDHTRASSKRGLAIRYNTLSAKTVAEWLDGRVASHRLHEFKPEIDFHYDGRGLGTRTIKTKSGDRLQVSAGILMNWAILEIQK